MFIAIIKSVNCKLRTRMKPTMFKHLSECEKFKETCNLYALPSLFNESELNEISLTLPISSTVLQNHEILDFNYNWSQLLIIIVNRLIIVKQHDKHDPIINIGLEAKELLLFN